MGSAEYGENTGNSACTYNEAKFAQGKGKTVILIRMIPFEEKFKHLQARIMFGLNKLEVPWMLGTPMPTELPDMLMEAMGLPKWVPSSLANSSPLTPTRKNENWPDELAELVSIPEFVACLAELDIHTFDDFADNVDAEDEGHDKMLMAVLEALPTKPRKKKLFRNRVIMVAQNLLQLLAVFIEYDTDEDGFLSRVECLRIPEHKAVAKSGGIVAEVFDVMDANKDGRISFQELFENCVVADSEEGVPPMDEEAEMKAARAAAEREKAAHEEMLALKREQAALEVAQREQAAAEAAQNALAQQRAQIDEQAEHLRRQQADFERKAQAAAMEAQRKLDEASRQLDLQARQQAEQLELQMRKVQMRPSPGGHAHGGSPGNSRGHQVRKNNLKYQNMNFHNYSAQPHFHQINLGYPGLQLVHEKPYIFIVNDFLSADECGLLLGKARQLQQQTIAGTVSDTAGLAATDPRRGFGVVSDTRTSKGCILWNEEIPELRQRFCNLTQVSLGQLQPLKISRYDKGDQFAKHTDAITLKHFENSKDHFGDAGRPLNQFGKRLGECPVPNANRYITVFVYLNDVSSGGSTDFHWTQTDPGFYDTPRLVDTDARPFCDEDPKTGISIQPEAGMAVIHFPAVKPEFGGITDVNAYHRGSEADDTKFICQQFIYTHELQCDHLRKAKGGSFCPTAGEPDMSSVF
eukprot:COSAG03_NODE_504_length_7391_cov_53.058420_6_plen_692_part_00